MHYLLLQLVVACDVTHVTCKCYIQY